MAKQTYKKHLNKNNKSNNYKGNNFNKDKAKIEAINYTEGITVGELAALLGQNAVYRGSSEPFCRGAVWGRDEFSVRSSAGGYLLRTAGNFATLAARRLSAR